MPVERSRTRTRGPLTPVVVALYRRWGTSGVWALEFGIAMAVTLVLAGGVVAVSSPESDPSTRSVRANESHTAAPTDESASESPGQGIVDDDLSDQQSPQAEGEGELATYQPTGALVLVEGSEPPSGPDPVRTFSVKVEKDLPIEPLEFAGEVARVLGAQRSWSGRGGFSVQRVDSEQASFSVVLASPQTTDELCAPLLTNGIFSCAQGNAAILNFTRWTDGAEAFGGDLGSYRTYLVNHEVGHVFGHGHVGCPGAGVPAPVMMQQTKGVGSCVANSWPLTSET